MRRWRFALAALTTALVMMVMSLGIQPGPAAAQASAETQLKLTTVYSVHVPKPIAVLLPGVPMKLMADGNGWIGVAYPADAEGNEFGRFTDLEVACDTMSMANWPEAEIVQDTILYSVDQHLDFGSIEKGAKVRVFGRCHAYWYIYQEDRRGEKFGSVPLSDLTLDPTVAQQLNAAMPGFGVSTAESDQIYDDFMALGMQLTETYGGDARLWPMDVRVAYDEQRWLAGFYWEDAYAEEPGENDLTAAEALQTVKRYLTETLTLSAPTDAELNACFVLKQDTDTPCWHVYWQLSEEVMDFAVTGTRSDLPDRVNVKVDFARLNNCRESYDWTLAQRHAIAVAAHWFTDEGEGVYAGDDQPIAEGMLDETAARTQAWQYAKDELQLTDLEQYRVRLCFYNVGTVMPYDWPWETWCENRPVFRASFYDDDGFVGEIWFDGETGELYRSSNESSGWG